MATQLKEQEAETLEEAVEGGEAAAEGVEDTTEELEEEQAPSERDWEAEAREHGWTGKDEFKGDPDKWVDAETFVKRADEVMPFLKKQNTALKREIADVKREMGKAKEFFSKAEQRAYERAVKDLEARHDKAVESGDVDESRRIRAEMNDLKPAEVPSAEYDIDENQAREVIAKWITGTPWYMADEMRTKYADIQAELLAKEHGDLRGFPGGIDAALSEIEKRVERKYETKKKPSAVSNGGNAPAPKKGGRTVNDLPPDAKRQCLKWDANGLVKKEDYLKSYQWDD